MSLGSTSTLRQAGPAGSIGGTGSSTLHHHLGASSSSSSSSSQRQYNTVSSPGASSSSRLSPVAIASSHADPTQPQQSKIFFVRALYSYTGADSAALTFEEGDIIEVLSTLESGWWDGMLDNETRGWFPSNFVSMLTEEELEEMGYTVTSPISPSFSFNENLNRNGNGNGDAKEEKGMKDGEELSAEDVLGDWGEGGGGLEDLAREMMGQSDLGHGSEGHEEEEGYDENMEFQLAAKQRAAWAQKKPIDESREEEEGYPGEEGDDGDDFRPPVSVLEAARRHREETGGTVTAKDRMSKQEIPEDAWIPKLTPDGQVFYHNTYTGENSWDLPMDTPDEYTDEQEDEYFPPMSSTAGASRSSQDFSSVTHGDDSTDRGTFRAPPKAHEIPYPWAARLSDDGSQWYYVNRLTNETSREPPRPTSDDMALRASRLSLSHPPNHRLSLDLQKKTAISWEIRTKETLKQILTPKEVPTMGGLMDNISDALREIFEAAVAGSAAEEEMSRASDLGSQSGIAAAILREESAIEMLETALESVLASIRDLLLSWGYVGPLDPLEEMPRPSWVTELSMIGCIGALTATVHAAVESKKQSGSGLSIWAEVMRSATKLRDKVSIFPAMALPGVLPGAIDNAEGRALEARLGIEGLGAFMNGRWGFGKELNPNNRILDENVLREIQVLKDDLEGVITQASEDTVLSVLRLATKYRDNISLIDIAAVIDIDGDKADSTRAIGDIQVYSELIHRARYDLRDLDQAFLGITTDGVGLFSALCRGNKAPLEPLSAAVNASYGVLASLLSISRQQHSMASSGLVKSYIGLRSPNNKPRPTSMASSAKSRTSRQSRQSAMSSQSYLDAKRAKVRGLDEEFLDPEDLEYERMTPEERLARLAITGMSSNHSTPGGGQGSMPSPSQSGSHVSLARIATTSTMGPGNQNPVSATSSTTSLAYQRTDSDSASTKGSNRASFMRAFMRGRSGSDEISRRNKQGSQKLAKILGEDPTGSQYSVNVPPPQAPAQAPWYLGEDYPPEDIMFDDKGNVKAGTLRALVVRLTPHGSTDTAFFQAFMLTFRSFTSGDGLLDLLFERFNIEPPSDLNETQEADWKKQKQTPIRLRVSNVLRAWLDVHWMEAQDRRILDRIDKFNGTTILTKGTESLYKTLSNLIVRRRQGADEGPRRIVSGGMLSPPAPFIPRIQPGRELRLTDINPIELARQLTMIEFANFQKIKPGECLHKAWNDEDEEKAPNVRRVIHTANKLAGWVSLLILQPRDAKSRATVMKYFITIAMELKGMNNFSSMAGVVAGLNAAPVDRLKRTKELLSAKTLAVKQELDRTMDSSKNFSNYKETLKTINPPCVPFFGFYLSALTFIEDGNKDFLNRPTASTPTTGTPNGMPTSMSSSSLASIGRGQIPPPLAIVKSNGQTGPTPSGGPPPLINFFKRSLSAEILRDIQQYQSQPYNLARCRPVYEYLMDGMERVEQAGDLYERSLMLEPREREEERITRMLHDSVRNPSKPSKPPFKMVDSGLMMAMF